MSTIAPPPASPETSQTRTRLLLAALKLFSEQGYAKTSIRAIAAEAQANVAAVSYYFGDKAALYAALFSDSFGSLHALVPDFTRPDLSLRAALRCFFQGALGPLHHGAIARQVVRLHIREMTCTASR
jgi:AcrR family transcriptional regulator